MRKQVQKNQATSPKSHSKYMVESGLEPALSSSKSRMDLTIADFRNHYSFLQSPALAYTQWLAAVWSWSEVDNQFVEITFFWKAEHYYLQVTLTEYFKCIFTETQ